VPPKTKYTAKGGNFMAIEGMLKELKEKKDKLKMGGGKEKLESQHAKGKLSARERLDILLDKGSFVEINGLMKHRAVDFDLDKTDIPEDGVITGFGTIDGRIVYVFSQDFTVMGGSLGEAHAFKISYLMDQAMKVGAPVIGINDSGGARIQEGVDSLKGYGEIFYRNTISSGVIPQITAIMGPCAGGAVYSPAIGDFVFMTDTTSYMFITGPQVVKTVLHQDVTFEELGGPQVHETKSGMAHRVGKNDEDTLNLMRALFSYLPSNNMEDPPAIDPTDDPMRETTELYSIIPEDSNKGYHASQVIKAVLDNNDFFEIHPLYAPNIIVGFGRLDGKVVGIVANNPSHIAGVLDINSSDKASRFVRFCDAFNIPILTFVDTPGYMPGLDQEHGGIIRHGAKLLYAYSEATVPLITVIVRKAYGGAYIAMASKHLRADAVYALPTAEIAVMGPKGACEIVFRKEISEAKDPAKKTDELSEDYKHKFANPYMAAARGYVDDVVDPKNLRTVLINSLRVYLSKKEVLPKRKHGIIPF
jgi:acetyl-CoA carboxylase carboxyltransferase component